MIEISVNGDHKALEHSNLMQALEHWGYQCDKIAIAINGHFIPRHSFASTELQAGDKLDIVAPIQGG